MKRRIELFNDLMRIKSEVLCKREGNATHARGAPDPGPSGGSDAQISLAWTGRTYGKKS